MPFKSNTYYSDPALGAGIESLGGAIFGDPSKRVDYALRGAQGQYYNARTDAALEDARRNREQFDAQSGIGNSIGEALFSMAQGPNVDGSAGIQIPKTPEEIRASMPGLLNAAGRAYGNKADALGQIFQLIGGLSGDQGLGLSGLTAAGHMPGKDTALTPGVQDRFRSEDEAARMARERLQQDGAMAREQVQEGGRNARRFDHPINVNDGNTVFFPPGHPSAPATAVSQGPGMGSMFTVPAAPGAGAGRYVQSPNPDGTFSWRLAKEGLAAPPPGAASRQETLSAQIRAEDALMKLVDQAAGAQYENGKLVEGSVDLPQDARVAVASRAKQIITETPGVSPLSAATQALNEITDYSEKSTGLFGNGTPKKSRKLKPPAEAAAPTTTPAPQSAAPPPAARVVGQVYPSPKGPVMWTEAGWQLVGG